MLFATTDDRIKKLEKRLDSIEKEMNKTLISLNDALLTVTDVITGMQRDHNIKGKGEIIASQRQIESQIKDLSIKKDIKEAFVPVKEIISDNFDFMQTIAREGIGPSMQDLLRIVEKEGEIRMQDAASKMKVHEIQVEQWANALKDQKLILIAEKKNKKYLCSVPSIETKKQKR